jgi:hypothetical protein
MPYFETEVDVDPREFVDSCSTREITQLINYLIEEGHLPPECDKSSKPEHPSVLEGIWDTAISKISNNRLLLTPEEEETIIKISNKF